MPAKSPKKAVEHEGNDRGRKTSKARSSSVSRARSVSRDRKCKQNSLGISGGESLTPSSASPAGNMDTATIEASLERLRQLEEENLVFSDRIAKVVTESRLYMEASIEDLKTDFNRKISNLSGQLQSVYKENAIVSSSSKSGRTLGPYNRKLFLPRESMLSKMLDHNDENYKTIFNIALSVLFLWGIWLALEDYEEIGIPNFELLTWGIIRDLGPFFANWSVMFFGCFSIVLMAHFAAVSKGFPAFGALVGVYASFQIAMFCFSWKVVFCREKRFSLPMSVGFMAEQIRMSMKIHAYFREKVLWERFGGKFASQPKSCDASHSTFFGLPFPQLDYFMEEIGKFGYFMFAPTLIYRDSYPRTSRIRWGFVICRLAEFFGIVYYAFLIFREVLPQFSNNIGHPIDAKQFLRLTFRCM
jgi:sterol O-acyltransferase